MYTTEGMLDLHRRAYQCYGAMLEHISGLSPELLNQQIDGFGFSTLMEQFNHLIQAEVFWLGMLGHEPSGDMNDKPAETVEQIREQLNWIDRETLIYLDQTDSNSLNSPIQLEFPDCSFKSTPGLVLAHLITHGFHHKGQIAAMCRFLGHPAGDTDMVIGLN